MKEILVVDDEPDTALLVKTMLKDRGYKVSSALNGEEALRDIAANRYDLVLIDVMMPGMDGWETAEKARKLLGDEPVMLVMFTTKAADVERIKEGDVVADWYVKKPINREKFLETVDWLLEKPFQ